MNLIKRNLFLANKLSKDNSSILSLESLLA